MTRIVHSYGRFSDPVQKDGTSIERQDKLAEEFCKAHGFTLSDLHLLDEGKSAYRGDKQKALNEFKRIMRAKDGRIKAGDILFVEEMDRLCRKGINATQDLVREIFDHGLDIATQHKIYSHKNKDDLMQVMEIVWLAWGANEYSKKLAGRVKRFYEHAREQARKHNTPISSGSTPAWLDRKGKKDEARFQVREEAAKTIAYIFRRAIEGAGTPTICKELNAAFPPISKFKKSKKWNEVYIRSILQDRRVLGEVQLCRLNEDGDRIPEGEVLPNYYPRIIDEKTFLKANAAIKNRRVERGPSKEYVNLLTGLAWHPIDQCPMNIYTYQQIRADGKRVIFRRLKSQHAQDNVPSASTETIDLPAFENSFLMWLRELDLSVFDESESLDAQLAAMQSQLQAKGRRLSELQLKAADDAENLELLLPAIKKLRDEIKPLATAIENLKTRSIHQPSRTLETLRALQEMDNTNENRQKLREAIKRVVKRINIIPVKLGTLRRSEVAAYAEVEFQNGSRRVIWWKRGFRGIALSMGCDLPPLHERPKKDLLKLKRSAIAWFKAKLPKA